MPPVRKDLGMPISPIQFKRGASFSLTLAIPSSVADGAFQGWTLKSQIRKVGNDLPSGLIADLSATWQDPNTTRVVVLQNNITDGWPICDAEYDVMFTSPKGQKVRSVTVPVTILKGVTHNG